MLRGRGLVAGFHERYRGVVERCRRFVRTRSGRLLRHSLERWGCGKAWTKLR